MSSMRALVGAVIFTAWTLPASAAPPEVHALTKVRIVVAPGKVIESGTIVLRDGVIEAVGANVTPPADARVWEREGLTVYPGLIDLYTTRPWPEDDPADKKQPEERAGHPNSMVRPERNVAAFVADKDKAAKLREAGFTTALVAPADGVFRGTSVLLNLGDGTVRDNLLAENVSQNVSVERTSGDGYPGSLMGTIALLRQTFHDATWYTKAQDAYRRKPSQKRPAYDTALDALGRAAAGKQPVVIEAGGDSADALLRAGALAAELNLDAWLVGNGYEYQRLPQVAALKRPLVLPVAFPEAPLSNGDDSAVELAALRHWDRAPANPKALAEAGVNFALTSNGLGSTKDLHKRLAAAIGRGFTADAALAALTTIPAKWLGLSDRLGTLDAGKMANLVVLEGDLFTDKTALREVWVDGRRYELKERKAAEIEPAGTWEITINAGGQSIPATLELSGKAPSLTGHVTAMGQKLPLQSAEVSGKSIEVSLNGPGGVFTLNLNIDGEEASGTGTSPNGPFTLRGKRTSGPPSAADFFFATTEAQP